MWCKRVEQSENAATWSFSPWETPVKMTSCLLHYCSHTHTHTHTHHKHIYVCLFKSIVLWHYRCKRFVGGWRRCHGVAMTTVIPLPPGLSGLFSLSPALSLSLSLSMPLSPWCSSLRPHPPQLEDSALISVLIPLPTTNLQCPLVQTHRHGFNRITTHLCTK